ncbi:MAG: DedA family protein [Thermoanaerobaculia bacterium]
MGETIHRLLATWMQFVLDWGYIGIFLMMVCESTALPIPAEVVLPPAAFWAARGRFNLVAIVIVATLGSWVGSALSYWIALKLGRPLVEKYGKYVLMSPAKVAKADHWFEEYGSAGIFIARLLPGIRHLISIPAGLFEMDFKWFSLMTIAGAGLFNGALTWFGLRVLGDQPQLMSDPEGLRHALASKSYWLVGFALVVGALYALMHWMQKRAATKRAVIEPKA